MRGYELETLFWLYFANFIFLIIHEMDSAYWEEWQLFKLPGGITAFLAIHFPLFSFFMYGLILVYEKTGIGLIFSLILSFSGIFAYAIHTYFIKRGKDEFNTFTSKAIMISTFILSAIQLVYTSILRARQ